MDGAASAILLAALCALALQARSASGAPGPGGRTAPVPRYQRRALGALAWLLVALVVASWLRLRGARGEPSAAAHLVGVSDALMLASLAVTFVALRGRPTRDAACAVGVSLGTYCAAMSLAHASLALGSVTDEGARHLRDVAAAWGLPPSASGFIALLHYGLAAPLIAAGVAAHDDFLRAPEWGRDLVLRKTSLATSALALLYVVFAARALLA